MSALKNYLDSNEMVIDRFSPITFQEIPFDCAITNRRILLYRRDKMQFTDFKHELTEKLSLEKEWYAEFSLFMIMALIFGSIWFISGICYSIITITNEALNPPVMVIRALIYPGLILLCIGLGGLYIYLTHLKLHILIETPEVKAQLFSKSEVLDELSKIYESLKSGEIKPAEGVVPEITNEQYLTKKPIATFNKISVKITFKDDDNKKRSIGAQSEIIFTEASMQITSRRLISLKEKNIYQKYIGNREIPIITEENISKLFDLAKELNIFWFLLMDFHFDLRKLSLQDSHFYTGPADPTELLLKVTTTTGDIVIVLKKRQFRFDIPAKKIVEMRHLIKDLTKSEQ
jgi:hypothetical protein